MSTGSARTKDGRTFSHISINSKDYDLDKGRLFLLSTEDAKIRILQLDRDPTKLRIGNLNELAELENDPDLRDFFAASDGNAGNE